MGFNDGGRNKTAFPGEKNMPPRTEEKEKQ